MLTTIKVKRNLTWRELKALNDLYAKRKTQAKVQDSDYFKYLIDDAEIIERKLGNSRVLLPTDNFIQFYENSLRENFNHYVEFLEHKNLETDARKNYNEEDIKALMFIDKNKNQIVPNLTTINKFSGEFFRGKGSKYLANKPSVLYAVLRILEINDFPASDPKEHQWRFVVDCPNPKAVVLCENLNFLKLPWIAERYSIKLWYVGGNNIAIIDQIDQEEFKRPLFYSADWDLAGLKIYSRIKHKLANRNKNIALLFPSNLNNRLPVNSPYHNSKWEFTKEFSGLFHTDFNIQEISLIQDLINNNQWIEEESNDLIKMLSQWI
ncbi:MAG: hypothetical protein F9K23_09700 [Bacteroidetes bacterium]|nr:MAG: hypothetical protein F9K23_09700 [Bacteroidota bacterium]